VQFDHLDAQGLAQPITRHQLLGVLSQHRSPPVGSLGSRAQPIVPAH
jgi:hypothetical protein